MSYSIYTQFFFKSLSGLFSYTGISFRLSKKILDYAKEVINKNEIKHIFYFNLFELLYECYTGNWDSVKEYDENMVDRNLSIGEYWHVSTYIVFHGYIKIEQGAFSEVEIMIKKLSEIWQTYQNENATEYRYSLKIVLLILFRKLNDALDEANAGITFQRERGREMIVLYYLGYKAIIQIHQDDISGAKETLMQAKELTKKIGFVPPIYISGYLKGHLLFDLYLLERAILSNDKSNMIKYRKMAYQSGKLALKNSNKYAFDKTESLRLMGVYYWLVGRQKKAAGCWSNSIKIAKLFGARVELAKTYLEIGKRFLEKKSRYSKLNNIGAAGYLEKAKSLFEEFGLLEELDKIK